jgi:hypothetical protein
MANKPKAILMRLPWRLQKSAYVKHRRSIYFKKNYNQFFTAKFTKITEKTQYIPAIRLVSFVSLVVKVPWWLKNYSLNCHAPGVQR